ncbi:MAG: hypothetical protein QM778_18515 [Myxococcales bacterium]
MKTKTNIMRRAVLLAAMGLALAGTGVGSVRADEGHEAAERINRDGDRAANRGDAAGERAAREAASAAERASPDRAREIERDYNRGN